MEKDTMLGVAILGCIFIYNEVEFWKHVMYFGECQFVRKSLNKNVISTTPLNQETAHQMKVMSRVSKACSMLTL